MPTGSGKSAIYQVPTVMLGGPAVVVSPLIALQRPGRRPAGERGTGRRGRELGTAPVGHRQGLAGDPGRGCRIPVLVPRAAGQGQCRGTAAGTGSLSSGGGASTARASR
ncbi:hypothetical protein ABT116_24305 [Streptomyces sp. NPDC002130]|uniref:hypothetical protein n=1 Tax=Streptomyces sp. NPDC002130 TaxID=3155568 RepID=UPI0033327C0C